VLDYVDARTGLRPMVRYLLDRRIPPGIGWLHTFGSASLTLFGVLLVTGMFLALGYSPSLSDAHASTQYIQHQVPLGGWLLGMHYWAASALVVVVTLHLLRVFFTGAFKYPRELSWVTGTVLLVVILIFAFTGYLLPWDNTAFFATRVGINIIGSVPVGGPALATLLRGGPELGAATLTRFFAFHVLFLPALALLFIAVHLFLVVRSGIAPLPRRQELAVVRAHRRAGEGPGAVLARGARVSTQEKVPEVGESFYPRHVFYDVVVSFAAVAVVFLLAVIFPVPDSGNANPADTTFVPRPAWYFLGFFQLLKYFSGPLEVVVTAVLPLALFGGLFLVPWLDRGPRRHPFNRPLATLLAIGALLATVGLTILGGVSS
jgi:ubiquinol-cytochrome c reductase cytochrome b subunit